MWVPIGKRHLSTSNSFMQNFYSLVEKLPEVVIDTL